ncbi:hypothetical protein Dimus_030517 [Dionaea muscipula]
MKSAADFDGVGFDNRESDVSSSNHHHPTSISALASGTMGKHHGCVLISGTGSISYGFTEDGHEVRAGGGGPVLGVWGRFFLISLILNLLMCEDVFCFLAFPMSIAPGP